MARPTSAAYKYNLQSQATPSFALRAGSLDQIHRNPNIRKAPNPNMASMLDPRMIQCFVCGKGTSNANPTELMRQRICSEAFGCAWS
jgi:hypothetical protein